MNENRGRELKIDIDQREDAVIVTIEGRIIRENQSVLRSELENLVFKNASSIALNLEEVTYMDSAGLGCCAHISKLINDNVSGSVAVFGASSDLEKTWSLIRLDLVIPMFSNEADAITWLRSRKS